MCYELKTNCKNYINIQFLIHLMCGADVWRASYISHKLQGLKSPQVTSLCGRTLHPNPRYHSGRPALNTLGRCIPTTMILPGRWWEVSPQRWEVPPWPWEYHIEILPVTMISLSTPKSGRTLWLILPPSCPSVPSGRTL